MRLISSLSGLAMMFMASGAFADTQMFTPEEFSKVADVAVAQFKADMPQHVSMFYGISLTRNVQDGQEIGLLTKIYTKMNPTDQPSVMAKYNCHKHETGELECHPAN